MEKGLVQTFRLRVKCSPSGHRRLTQVFGMCAEMYNACLDSWRGTYKWWAERHNPEIEKFPKDRNYSKYDLFEMLIGVRKDHPEWERLSVQVGRGVLTRWDRTKEAYFKRCREGENPGYPRFKPAHRWRSIEIPSPTTSMIVPPNTVKNQSVKWWRLQVKGLPRIRFGDRNHRLDTALEGGGKLVELRVVRSPLRTEVHVVIKHPPTAPTSEEAGAAGGNRPGSQYPHGPVRRNADSPPQPAFGEDQTRSTDPLPFGEGFQQPQEEDQAGSESLPAAERTGHPIRLPPRPPVDR